MFSKASFQDPSKGAIVWELVIQNKTKAREYRIYAGTFRH